MLLCSCLDFYTRDCGPWLWTKHLGLVCHCSRENKFKWGECKTKCWGNRDQVNRFILHICCPTLCLVSFQWSNKGAVYMIPEWLSFWNNWVYSISSYFPESVHLISRRNFVPIQVIAVFILNAILVLVRNFIVVSCNWKRTLFRIENCKSCCLERVVRAMMRMWSGAKITRGRMPDAEPFDFMWMRSLILDSWLIFCPKKENLLRDNLVIQCMKVCHTIMFSSVWARNCFFCLFPGKLHLESYSKCSLELNW